MRLSSFIYPTIFLPSLNTQQQIIDIIEPVEKFINKLQSINNLILKLSQYLSSFILSKELMMNACEFIKGSNEPIIENGRTLFLNVAAANNRPNRYIQNNPNINYGDITLSLDGTTGLVNKSLIGFNGYLYKVISTKYKNYEIYFSLLTNENQNIIKLNETGTTIKHSPNSKKQLYAYKFLHDDELSNLFNLSLKIEKYIPILTNLKSQLIQLLIK